MGFAHDRQKKLGELLIHHPRFSLPPEGTRCEGKLRGWQPWSDTLYSCTYNAKYAYTRRSGRKSYDKHNYCLVHLFKEIRHDPYEVRMLSAWVARHLDVEQKAHFEKKYPRRMVKWLKPQFQEAEGMWGVIHLANKNSKGILVSLSPDFDEAMRVARHFKR